MEFDQVYQACFHKVYRFALSLTRKSHEAEEIAQETFFHALRHISSLPADAALDAWLFRIAKNLYISRLRKRKKEAPDPLPDTPSPDTPESLFLEGDQAARILRQLHTLPEPYKEVFTLRALGEVSYTQIALLFEKNESWARVTYYRARQLLSERMKKEEEI